MNLHTYLTSFTKINSKWATDLNVNVKHLGETYEKFSWLSDRQRVLRFNTKSTVFKKN